MSVDRIERCGVCRCYLDDEDLFCGNCGTENLMADAVAKEFSPHAASQHSFTCQGCGASMSYDASAQALRCPFCGSTQMTRQRGGRSITPSAVIPLQVTRQRAEAVLREWLGRGFWRPADAARAATIGEMTAVYVPYWVFAAETDSAWTADSSPAPPGCRGDWYPLSGQHASKYDGVLVGGSSVLTPHETQSIGPFDLRAAVPPQQVDLQHAIAEQFCVPRKTARPLARAAIERLDAEACSKYVPNRSRNVKVNVTLSALYGRPVLLPVWILAYQYKETVFRVLINGQTAAIAGDAPFSYRKLSMVLLCALALIAVIMALAALTAVVSS